MSKALRYGKYKHEITQFYLPPTRLGIGPIHKWNEPYLHLFPSRRA